MNKIIIPPKLNKGDTIRIIAPSCSGKTVYKDRLEIARKLFEKLGFKITYSKNLFELNKLQSSSIKSRLEDLHDAFADKSVKAIIAIRGGFNVNDLLDYIDWKVITKNPKIYCGFSDNTALQNAILQKTGLITYSGPNFASFGKTTKRQYTLDSFLKYTFDFNSEKNKIKENNVQNFDKISIINPGKAKGNIVGGNLCTLNLLQGTPYMPSLKNTILFIEDDHVSELDAWEFSRNLQSVINLPEFKFVKGIAIGKFQKESKLPIDKLKEIIKSKPALRSVPIIANLNFGHTLPIFTFPIGGKVSIDTSKINPLSISLL